MPDSQNPDHVRKLIQEFQLKGAALIPTVTGEVVPTVQLADLSEASAVDRAAQGGTLISANAGSVGEVQLFNPADSGILIELYACLPTSTGNQQAQMGPVTAALTVQTNAAQWQDRRLQGSSFPVGVIQADNTGGAANLINPTRILIVGNTSLMIPWLRVKLPPSTGWKVETTATNQNLFCSFWWTERDLLAGEV